MRWTKILQETRKMRFEEAYSVWTEKRLSQGEAAKGISFQDCREKWDLIVKDEVEMNCPAAQWWGIDLGRLKGFLANTR